MKRLLLATVFALLPFVAQAQEAIDRAANALPAQNFGIIADSRWLPVMSLASLATAGSQRLPLGMSGTLVEAWLTLDTSQPQVVGAARINVSLSRRNSASIQALGQFILDGPARDGGALNLNCAPGAVFSEGDAIIVAIPTITGAVSSVVRITFRVSN